LLRFLAFLVLVGLVAAGVHYWKARPEAERSPLRPEGLGEVGQKLRDTALKGQLKAAFELDRGLKRHAIEIGVEDGAVTLAGRVPDEELKRRAEAVAAAVPDVRDVTNRLEVDPGAAPPAEAGRSLGESLDDKKLEVQVRLAFSLRRELSGTDLTVSAYRREVTLSGEVSSEAQQSLAIDVARHTAGVQGVLDQIRLRGAAERPPSGTPERRAAVERALGQNENLARYLLRVDVKDGRIVISGTVRNGAERDLAGLLARDAAGGTVENAISVAR
jgi:osmotically-inducible protein OsmY